MKRASQATNSTPPAARTSRLVLEAGRFFFPDRRRETRGIFGRGDMEPKKTPGATEGQAPASSHGRHFAGYGQRKKANVPYTLTINRGSASLVCARFVGDAVSGGRNRWFFFGRPPSFFW